MQHYENHCNLIIEQVGQGIKLIRPDQANSLSRNLQVDSLFNMPFHVYLQDSDGVIQKINESTRFAYNILSIADANGKHLKKILRNDAAEHCLWQDQEVINSNSILINDHISVRLGDEISFPVLSIKFPWYSISNKTIGIFGCSIILEKNWGMTLSDSLAMLTQTGLLQPQYTLNQRIPGFTFGDIYFTQSEKNILLHLVRGKSAREIATILDRSKRTIEQHIVNMKAKTNSASKSELIEKIVDRLL